MIIAYHKNNTISKVVLDGKHVISFHSKGTVSEGVHLLASQFPESRIAWCEESYKEYLDLKEMKLVFYHNRMLLSYCPGDLDYLGTTIGYVEESPFIKINKKVRYPTWQMSSIAGMTHASLLLEIKDQIKPDVDFDYYLNSIAKICIPLGLMCYSEPKLLRNPKNIVVSNQGSLYVLFRFVKQHYRTRWVFLLLLNLFLYKRKFPVLPFLCSLFYKNRTKTTIDLDAIKVKSSQKEIDKATVEVIIPTIGRKNYLLDFLKDLKAQTHPPTNVIVVEQNPDQDSTSDLDYLAIEKWPFEIQHIFTHKAGACNARNIALEQIKSEWVFFADDDIRLGADFFEKAFENISKFSAKAVSFRCFQKGQKQSFSTVFQWITFGSGCSFVLSDSLKGCKFNMGYEFGFGEDGDFGMQLRNQGCDVLYLPEPEILHLKAPMGGFRTKPVLQWQDDEIQPKPSPTIMLYQILHHSEAQRNSYKTILFFKYYRIQTIKNPFQYYINFQKQWERSVFWANELRKQNEI